MPAIKCPIDGCGYETPDTSDIIVAALLNAHCSVHSQGTSKSTAEKIKRPTIAADSSLEDWSYFLSRWDNYKVNTNIGGEEEVIQLLECLDDDLRMNLTRSLGNTLTQKKSTELIVEIKKFAVREENLLISRMDLHNMKQDHDEPVQKYVSRLKGKAFHCKLSSTCPTCNTGVDFSESLIIDIICKGLYDQEIQTQLIACYQQDMTLTQIMQFIE